MILVSSDGSASEGQFARASLGYLFIWFTDRSVTN